MKTSKTWGYHVRSGLFLVALLECGLVATLAAAADPDVVCQAAKLKLASKYGACRLRAEANALRKNAILDDGACDGPFEVKWIQTEVAAGSGVCPSQADRREKKIADAGGFEFCSDETGVARTPTTSITGTGGTHRSRSLTTARS